MSTAFIVIVALFLFSCDPPNKTFDPEYVKLKSALNNNAETISLGDTLKIILTIPDTLNGVSKQVFINSLQEGFYACTFYNVDTVTKFATRMTGNAIFVTKGSFDGTAVYVTTDHKPFTSILNLVPPAKGLYYIQITPQPGTIRANNSYEAGLRVNFDVSDKHWIMYNNYVPGFYPGITQFDDEGYGWYCFKVN